MSLTSRKKPAIALGATALVVLGVTGFSAQARSNSDSATSTTPSAAHGGPGYGGPGHGGPGHGGPGRGDDAAALAKALGVSTSDLAAAVKSVRDAETKPDPAARGADEAKAIATALGVDQATVQTVLDAQRPAGGRPGGPMGTTPPKDGVRPTTPPAKASEVHGTTPDHDGDGPRGPHGGPGGFGGHGGPGGHSLADQTALIAALVKATGKDTAAVTAALKTADAAHQAEEKARMADFAKKLAAKLNLDEAKVTAALEASRPTPPSGNATPSPGQKK